MRTWDDITIVQAEKIFAAGDKHEHKVAQRAARYAVAMGEDYDKLINMTLSDFENHTKEWRFLDTQPIPKIVHKWQGFDLVSDIKDLTQGQLIDIETTTREGKNTLHRILGFLWKSDKGIEEKEKYIRENMPYVVARGVHDFFLSRSLRWQRRLLKYLEMTLRIEVTKIRLQTRLDRFFGGLFGRRK